MPTDYRDTILDTRQQHPVIGQVCPRDQERISRPAEQKESDSPIRMVSTSTDLPTDLEGMGHPLDRPVRHQVKPSTSGVHLSHSRSSSLVDRHSSPTMEPDDLLCLSSHGVDKKSAQQSQTSREPAAIPDSSKLAPAGVVR